MRGYKIGAQKPSVYERYGVNEGKYILATLHRAENVDDPERLLDYLSNIEVTAIALDMIGVHDLSIHFEPFWYRSVRRAVEERMIRRYHESLRAGVSGYTWDQCWYDYRLGVVGQFNRRIKHDPFNSAVGVWTHDNCISAFEDYNAKN